MMRYGRMNVTGRWPPLPDKFTMVACVCELFVVPREQNIFVRDCAPGNKELIATYKVMGTLCTTT